MKNLMTKHSCISIICFLFISMPSIGQTTSNTNNSVLPASTVVNFPITTQHTTDPNYETNVAKYKDFKEYVPATGITVKNEAYYLKAIQDMKNNIANKEKMEAKSPDILMKIENLKSELIFLENNYMQLIK